MARSSDKAAAPDEREGPLRLRHARPPRPDAGLNLRNPSDGYGHRAGDPFASRRPEVQGVPEGTMALAVDPGFSLAYQAPRSRRQ